MNRESILAKLVLIAGVLVIVPSTGLSQSFNPVISLQSSDRHLPLFNQAIKDPVVAKAGISDPSEADALRHEISEYNNDLKRAKGVRRTELLKLQITNHLNLSYYLQNVLDGVYIDQSVKGRKELVNSRNQILVFTKAYLKVVKSKAEKAKVQYYFLSTLYQLSPKKRSSVANQLAKIKHLPSYLKKRADLIVLTHKTNYGSTTALKDLKSLIKPLPLVPAIVARLSIAKQMAKAKDKQYRKYLYTATRHTRRLSRAQRVEVLEYALAVWRRVDGNKTWKKPPMYLASFRGFKNIYGISERQAIQNVRNKQYQLAAKIYQHLSDAYGTNPISIDLDYRLVLANQLTYKSTKKYRAYEKSLLALRKKYQISDTMMSKYKEKVDKFMNFLDIKYRSLVQNEIKIAKRKNASKHHRRSVIALIDRYASGLEAGVKREHYQAEKAELYALNDNHAKAVGIFLDLALNGTPSKKREYLEKAATSQTVLAHWSAAPPWTKVSSGHSAERAKLADIYEQISSTYERRTYWPAIAHIGLLKVSLNQHDDAFKLWQESIEKAPQSKLASQASGFMLVSYQNAKNWQGLEDVSRLSLKKGVQPRHGRQALNASELLAIGLLNGGQEKLAAKQYDEATKKLKEFTERYPSHKHHDKGLFLLAHAFRGQGNHIASIKSLTELSKKHPKSSFLEEGLLKGGQWSMAMALEENTIYFYEKYLERFSASKDAHAVRNDLIMLYDGRQLYAEKAKVLRSKISDKRLSKDDKVKAQVDLMELEERHGSLERAKGSAEAIISHKGIDPEAKALAYSVLGRYYHQKNNLKELSKIDRSLSEIAHTDSSKLLLAEIRYYLADRKKTFLDNEIYSLTLTDPLKSLNTEWAKFVDMKKAYESVCNTGQNTYCAHALYAVALNARKMSEHIADISISEKLAEKLVSKFNTRKESMLKQLDSYDQSFNAKALNVVQSGQTNPAVTQQVLWENSNDWNFDRITGETGNGYVQFSPALVMDK